MNVFKRKRTHDPPAVCVANHAYTRSLRNTGNFGDTSPKGNAAAA